jgi:diguanylate cyclase (GGDEF)-like protein
MPLLESSLALVIYSTVSIIILYSYLYKFHKQRFLKTWILGWSTYLISQVLIFVLFKGLDIQVVKDARQVFSILSSSLFLVGAHEFINKPIQKSKIWRIFFGIIIIILLARICLSERTITVCTQFIIGSINIYIGVYIYKFRNNGNFLIKLVSWTFILWGIHKFDYLFLYKSSSFAPWGYFISAVFQCILAIGMVLIIINQRTNDKTNELNSETEEQLKFMVYYDKLTGLPNRTMLMDEFNKKTCQSVKENSMLGIIYLNIDRFKNLDDVLGHTTGNMLLKKIAQVLQKIVEEKGLVSRICGDEFSILIWDIYCTEEIKEILNNISESLRMPMAIANYELYITASFGVSIYLQDGNDFESLIRNADIAMHRAKEIGRDNYQFFHNQMKNTLQDNFYLANYLRNAIEKEELFLHFQPNLDSVSGKIVGAEALARWNHSKFGEIPPGTFIPIAEETGLIVPIGEWILREACIQNKIWQDKGLPRIKMAVNVSVRQLYYNDFYKTVVDVLNETGLEPYYLELEITESVTIKDIKIVNDILKKLKRLGVHIAMDDFGTGYSSLSYLNQLDIDKLKLDQSFIRNITSFSENKEIAAAIIKMAHALGLKVTAEGVETVDHVNFLKEQQCDYMQGYYFSKPVVSEEIEKLLNVFI